LRCKSKGGRMAAMWKIRKTDIHAVPGEKSKQFGYRGNKEGFTPSSGGGKSLLGRTVRHKQFWKPKHQTKLYG